MSDRTLTPVYEFVWTHDDGRVTKRRTDDADAFSGEPHPDSVEALAAFGREDPDCEVRLLGMGST